MEHDLFISYQWDVQKQVRKLNEFLKSNNYDVWMDVHQLSAGSSCLHSQLASSIKNSKAVICCITEKYTKSKNCYLELNWAHECGKKLIVLMFEDLKVSELERVGFIISPQLRINLFENKQVIDTWQGPKSDELLKAVQNALGEYPLILRQDSPIRDQVRLVVPMSQTPAFSNECSNNSLPIILKTNNDNATVNEDKQSCAPSNSRLSSSKTEYPPIKREVSPFSVQIEKVALPEQNSNVIIQKIDRKSPARSHVTTKLNETGKRVIASGSLDKTIKLWDLQIKKCIHTFYGHENWVKCMIVIDKQWLASGSSDKTIKIWDLNSKLCTYTLVGHCDSVLCLIRLNEFMLASGSSDKTIRIWNLKDYSCIFTLVAHDNPINCLENVGDNLLASGSEDKCIKLWDRKKFELIRTLNGHNGSVYCLKSINKIVLASGSEDKFVKFWNLKDFTCIQQFDNDCSVRCLLLIDEHRLALNYKKCIRMLNLKDLSSVMGSGEHNGSVLCINRVSENMLASGGSFDDSIKLWNINDLTCSSTLQKHEEWITCLKSFYV